MVKSSSRRFLMGPVTLFTCIARGLTYQRRTDFILGVENLEVAMAALARPFWRAPPLDSPELAILKQLAIFCGAGLLVSLLMMTYGPDLSPGFF